MKPTLEISIPVYNEERRLSQGLDKLIQFRQEHQLEFSVVVADNGSSDKTREIAENYSSKHKFISYLHVEGKGVGRALKKSWFQSKADIVGYLDVDHSTDLSHLLQVIDLFRNPQVHVVSGSRLIPGAKVRGRKISREISSRAFNLLLRTLLEVKFTDGMCGFKFLRHSVIDGLKLVGVDNDQWFFNTQILVKSEWLGYKITEIPILWTDDSDSKAKIVPLALEYTRAILKLRSEKRDFKNV